MAIVVMHWGDTLVVAHGKVYHPHTLPGFVAILKGKRVGLLTYSLEDENCEIVTLDSTKPGIGIGTLLIKAVKHTVDEELSCVSKLIIPHSYSSH